MTTQQIHPAQQVRQQSSDSHTYPFTTNAMDVPYTAEMFVPKQGTRESAQRHREIEGYYSLYQDVMKKPVILDWATFQRYLPLFNKKLLESINPSDEMQTNPLRALSEEFLKLINPYKEYHVRMPNGEMMTFPPIYSPVARLDDSILKALDIFDNILTKCTDQPWKREEATIFMISAMYESQNPAVVEYQQKKYRKYADAIHQKIYGSSISENMTADELSQKVNSEKIEAEQVTQGMQYVLD